MTMKNLKTFIVQLKKIYHLRYRKFPLVLTIAEFRASINFLPRIHRKSLFVSSIHSQVITLMLFQTCVSTISCASIPNSILDGNKDRTQNRYVPSGHLDFVSGALPLGLKSRTSLTAPCFLDKAVHGNLYQAYKRCAGNRQRWLLKGSPQRYEQTTNKAMKYFSVERHNNLRTRAKGRTPKSAPLPRNFLL